MTKMLKNSILLLSVSTLLSPIVGKYGICGKFAIRVNPTSRVANLTIYLTFTSTEKLSQMCNLSLHLLKYVNIQ